MSAGHQGPAETQTLTSSAFQSPVPAAVKKTPHTCMADERSAFGPLMYEMCSLTAPLMPTARPTGQERI
jgi:hypothetical protein